MLGADNSIVVRLKILNKPGMLMKVASVIAQMEASMGAIDLVYAENKMLVRDFTIYTQNPAHAEQVISKLKSLQDVEFVHASDRTFLIHLGGKIEIKSRTPIRNRDELSMAYTPGVARVCMAIHEKPADAYNLTMKKNMVAVVTDGTAVLGLGDIGPLAGLPVMEGKAILFKEFANVDAFPICLDTKDPEEIIKTIKNIAPGFGGINLEDISSPRCFYIEKRLKEELDIPVFHDDQHGTAIVLCAGFINALKIVKKRPEELKVVFSGVGAAGVACTHMLYSLGVKNIIGCDRKGILSNKRTDLDQTKKDYMDMTNPHQVSGSLHDAMKDADVFIGLSAPNLLTVEDLKVMAKDPIVFAMANPTPEIMPEIAQPYVAIMATGRSDYPNQVNNLLAFPGVFRGALDCHARDINESMKMAAAYAIANVILPDELSPDYIIPSVFDTRVATAVAHAVLEAARLSGAARN